jgi:hypothetical protein
MNVPAEKRSSWQIIWEDAAPATGAQAAHLEGL